MWKTTLKAFIIFLVMVLKFKCSTQKQDKDFIQKQVVQHAYKQWEKITDLISFERTIQVFPQLKQHMQIKKLIQLLEKGGCSNIWGSEPARYIIVDNQIYAYGINKDYQRVKQYKAYLSKISRKANFPDIFFILDYLDAIFPQLLGQDHLEQCKKIPAFVFNKNYSDEYSRSKFLLPDTYIIQPNWQDLINQVKNSSKQYKWNKKIPKLFFRGIPSGPHKYRFKMDSSVNFSKYFHRAALVQLGLSHPDLIDAYFSKDPGPLSDELQRRVGNQTKIFTYKVVSFSDHIKYKYLFSADGRGTAWKRLAFILFSNSLLVKPFSEQIQWFYDKIIPFTHFLQIKDDFSDIFERLQDVKKKEQKALEMIKNANEAAEKYLTPEAISNYTFETLVKYAKIQNLKLTPEQKLDIKNGIDAQLVLKLKIIKEEWESFPKIISLQQTINAFPFLKQNLNIFKIKELYLKGCEIQFANFFIFDNVVYCQGQFCKKNQSKNVKNLLQRITTKTILPDMYFLFAVDNKNLSLSKDVCRSIPYFIFKKNMTCPIQQTKFLLPNPSNELNQISFQTDQLKQKINKLYLQWTLPDYIYTQKQENFRKYIKQDKFLKQFKKYSDIIQARIVTNLEIKNDKFEQILKKLYGKKKVRFQQTPDITKVNYKYNFVSDKTKNSQSIIPHILSSGSIMFKPLLSQKIEWFYQKMIPGIHFISLREDISDLIKTVFLLSKNQDIVKRISRKVQFFAKKQLTRQAIDNYAIEVLLKYSQIQKLKLSYSSKQLIKSGINLFEALEQQEDKINQYILKIFTTIFWVVIMILISISIIQKSNNQKLLIKNNQEQEHVNILINQRK